MSGSSRRQSFPFLSLPLDIQRIVVTEHFLYDYRGTLSYELCLSPHRADVYAAKRVCKQWLLWLNGVPELWDRVMVHMCLRFIKRVLASLPLLFPFFFLFPFVLPVLLLTPCLSSPCLCAYQAKQLSAKVRLPFPALLIFFCALGSVSSFYSRDQNYSFLHTLLFLHFFISFAYRLE